MLSEKVTILACENGRLTIQSQRKNSCKACAMRKGCGQYLLLGEDESFSLDCGSYRTVQVETQNQVSNILQPGSAADMNVSSAVLIPITLLIYMLPLGFLLGGVGAGVFLAFNEPALVVLSFTFLGVGLLVSRKKLNDYQNARIVSITPHQSDSMDNETEQERGVC